MTIHSNLYFEDSVMHPMCPATSAFILGEEREITLAEAKELLSHICEEDGEWWYYAPDGQLRRAQYGTPKQPEGWAVKNGILKLQSIVADYQYLMDLIHNKTSVQTGINDER